jgi:hypothetical protein
MTRAPVEGRARTRNDCLPAMAAPAGWVRALAQNLARNLAQNLAGQPSNHIRRGTPRALPMLCSATLRTCGVASGIAALARVCITELTRKGAEHVIMPKALG